MRLYVNEIFHFVSKKVVEKRLECISKNLFIHTVCGLVYTLVYLIIDFGGNLKRTFDPRIQKGAPGRKKKERKTDGTSVLTKRAD